MYLLEIDDVDNNPFKNLDTTKQKIFSKFLIEDLEEVFKQYNCLEYYEDIFNHFNQNDFKILIKMLEEIEKQTTNASVLEDFSFSQLFDSNNLESKFFEFLKEFIRVKLKIN